jgi:pSer/pThr/pTyr-binding forkhead associated (FHA) protein
MNSTNRDTRNGFPPEMLDRVDDLCVRFEAAWKAGAEPRLESYLGEVGESERGLLLRELLRVELHYRGRRSERFDDADYLRRFPEYAELIRELCAPSPGTVPSANPAGGLILTVTEGPHQGQVFHFNGHDTFIVGRSKKAHFRLPARDEYFSRIHFLVEVNPPACRLVDMGSTNGTLVNGNKVTVADLKDGDVIQGGQTAIRVTFRADDESEVRTREFLPVGEKAPTGELAKPDASDNTPPVDTIAAEESLPPFVGGYQILRQLGQGGMGRVLLALAPDGNQVVAIKTIRPGMQGNAVQVGRFLREAEILCQLKHPNIVSYQTVGEDNGLLFFVMDHVPGLDAGKLLKRDGPFPVARAVNLVCQLLEALDYAHRLRFVHRDIKPANLMVSETEGRETLKVVDFGLARVDQASKLSGLTLTGTTGGTAPFLAPEQIVNFRDVRPAADQYAAAATLYNLLTGQYVYDFPKSCQNCLLMILQDEPVPIRSRRPELPEELAAVLHRGLAREPEARYPDVLALREALLPFGDEHG